MKLDQIKFVREYIKAIRRKMSTEAFAKKIGVSYTRVLQIKKKIAELTGKQLPPLPRPDKSVSINTLNRLVNTSYQVHKKQAANAKR